MGKIKTPQQVLKKHVEFETPELIEVVVSAMQEYASLRISELEERIHKQNIDHVQLQQDWLVKLNEVSVLEERIKVLEGWIPVSERMPEPMQDILFCNINVHSEGINTVSLGWAKSVGFYSYATQGKNKLTATHWKPVPEPPINNLNK